MSTPRAKEKCSPNNRVSGRALLEKNGLFTKGEVSPSEVKRDILKNRPLNLGVSLFCLVLSFCLKVYEFPQMTVTECFILYGILQYIWFSYREGKDIVIVLVTLLITKLFLK